MTAKEEILELVKELPADATFQSISEKIRVAAAVRQSQDSIAAGKYWSQEEVENIFCQEAFSPTAEERAQIMAAIERAEEDSAAGRTSTHEEIDELIKGWAKKHEVQSRLA